MSGLRGPPENPANVKYFESRSDQLGRRNAATYTTNTAFGQCPRGPNLGPNRAVPIRTAQSPSRPTIRTGRADRSRRERPGRDRTARPDRRARTARSVSRVPVFFVFVTGAAHVLRNVTIARVTTRYCTAEQRCGVKTRGYLTIDKLLLRQYIPTGRHILQAGPDGGGEEMAARDAE